MKDPFKILGIEQDASPEDAKKAFRKLAKEFHPDKVTSLEDKAKNEEKFKEIARAYDCIVNGKPMNESGDFQQQGSPFPNDFWGGGASSPFDPFSGGINDFMKDFFRGPYQSSAPRGSQPGTLVLKIPIQEIRDKDVVYYFEVIDSPKCDKCSGDPYKDKKICESCKGSGQKQETKHKQGMIFVFQSPCSACKGLGFTYTSVCDKCGGQGEIPTKKRFKIRMSKAEEINEEK
jgi:molecular chaperone DnaJ